MNERVVSLAQVVGQDVPRETFARLERFADLLLEENQRQNLISKGSEPGVWQRHIVDCAQLLRFRPVSHWLDVGSGAGLPGVVLAILGARVTLVEPRRLRAEFLSRTLSRLDLGGRVELIGAKVQNVSGCFDTITARAVAPPGEILTLTRRLAHRDTVWVLPRGRKGRSELAQLGATWQGEIRAAPSMTDGDATILIASFGQSGETP